jgi:hypothetical protein
MMLNHAGIGTQFVGPKEMIANRELLNQKMHRVTKEFSQYLLSAELLLQL